MTWFQMESEVNDMSPKNDFSDIFDDDFEVTYEEDPEINFHTSEDTEQINRPDSNTETIVMNADDYRDNFNDSDDSQFEDQKMYLHMIFHILKYLLFSVRELV